MENRRVLILVVIAQFAATSLWFAGNAIYPNLQLELGFTFDLAPKLTIAVQLGFIMGTLCYAIFMIPDRYSPSKVFLVSASLAAIINLALLFPLAFNGFFISRFLVGFFLAGIYPVGMKIITDWFKQGVGKMLGFLVGALVIGTSFPHFIQSQSIGISWRVVIVITSLLAIASGLIIYLMVGDGPYQKKATQFNVKAFFSLFENRMTNSASLGYFGHMWELYAFWAFIPAILVSFNQLNDRQIDISFWSFTVIAVGGLGSIIGGYASRRFGSCRVAFFAMLISGLCAGLSYLFFGFNQVAFLTIMLIWGFFVIMDSPQFSSVIADYANKQYLGSTLTIVNSIGFGLTIVSIKVLDYLLQWYDNPYWLLAIGPLIGLFPTAKVAFRKNFPLL